MLLTPHWVFDDYTAVTPDFLRAHGVTLLLTDLDYTLAPKSVREPDDAVRAWLAALAAAGVTVAAQRCAGADGGAEGRRARSVAEGAPCPAGAVQARERARRAHGAAIILQNLAQDRENYLQ